MKCLTFLLLCAALPPGAFPQNVSANAIAGMGYLYPEPVTVAPGQLITLFVQGNVQGNVSATLRQTSDYAAPVLAVRPTPDCTIGPSAPCASMTAITIQIPYEIELPCLACAILYPGSPPQLFVTANGVAGAPFPLSPQTDRIHLLTACDTVVPSGSGFANGSLCSPLVTHADASLVTAGNPARGGEEIVAYAVGLGPTTPAVPTGQAAATATPTSEAFLLDFNFRPNALATQPLQPYPIIISGAGPIPSSPSIRPATDGLPPGPLFSGLVAGYVGLYQINFVVPQPPAGMLACSFGTVQSNLTVSVGGLNSFDGAGICVAP
jgi:uncharacterized protein (TIGR03437 family)